MADNFLSYNRFTALPPNIAQFGTTVEELQLQKGAPDANPVVAPMAAPRVPETRLSLAPGGSDKMRLGNPVSPEVNPYEGPKSTLSLSRSAEKKLSGAVVGELGKLLQNEGIDPNQALMLGSLRCVRGLSSYLSEFIKMAQYVQVRSIAASKG